MKYYSFDYNGVFVGEGVADLCQVTEENKREQSKRKLKPGEALIKSVPIIPSFSTLIKPPAIDLKTQRAIFVNEKWVSEEIPVIPEPEIKPDIPDEVEPEKPIPNSVKRQMEYPSFYDYLDGVVKTLSGNPELEIEGQAQVKKYVSDCLAVKAKYPKE